MTLLADPTTLSRVVARRKLPLAVDLAALALVLLVLVPVVGTAASFSADEGAAIVQARSLARGDGWIVEHPLPRVDPTGVGYPLENSGAGARGVSPYAKHPLYAVILAGADRLGGVTAMVMLSLAGTVLAAGLAGLLARRLDPTLARPALWVVGLGSPLLFDGFLVIAHTLGAALAAAAVLLAIRAIDRSSVPAALALAPVVAAGVLLRTEFVFMAGALAVAAFAVGLSRRRRPAMPILVAAVAVAAAGIARSVEQAWTARILGPSVAGDGVAGALPGGGAAGRARGFVLTWLTTGYGSRRPVDLALLALLVLVVVGAYVVRRHPHAQRAAIVLAAGAAAAAAFALVADPANVVPGLLVACPVVGAGLVLVRRETLATDAARLCAGTFAVFALMVVATQYQRGGSGEWGGRYFALGIPVLVPVLVLALRSGTGRLPTTARRTTTASLAVCVVALSLMGVGALRAAHQRNAAMGGAVSRAALRSPAGDGGRPVVVAADGTLARHGWPTFDGVRWLRAGPDLPDMARRLERAGIREFVFVTRDSASEMAGLTIVSRESGSGAGLSWHVLVLARS